MQALRATAGLLPFDAQGDSATTSFYSGAAILYSRVVVLTVDAILPPSHPPPSLPPPRLEHHKHPLRWPPPHLISILQQSL